jgi:hypothetical protein
MNRDAAGIDGYFAGSRLCDPHFRQVPADTLNP